MELPLRYFGTSENSLSICESALVTTKLQRASFRKYLTPRNRRANQQGLTFHLHKCAFGKLNFASQIVEQRAVLFLLTLNEPCPPVGVCTILCGSAKGLSKNSVLQNEVPTMLSVAHRRVLRPFGSYLGHCVSRNVCLPASPHSGDPKSPAATLKNQNELTHEQCGDDGYWVPLAHQTSTYNF